MNEIESVATAVTSPARPISIRNMMICRRAGWFTTDSASDVVNPEPDSADRAWNRATSGDTPVRISATAATRVAVSEATTTKKKVTRAIIANSLAHGHR